jgi:hypothetical protein
VFSQSKAIIKGQDYYKEIAHTTTVKKLPENSKLVTCILCNNAHDLENCQEYSKKSLEEKKSFLKDKERCFGCYGEGHKSRGCLQKRTCKICERKHPTGLHDDNFQVKERIQRTRIQRESTTTGQRDSVTNITHACTVASETFSTVPVVPVKLKGNDKELITYAMLDNCSTGTFILEDLRNKLGIDDKDGEWLKASRVKSITWTCCVKFR